MPIFAKADDYLGKFPKEMNEAGRIVDDFLNFFDAILGGRIIITQK